MSLLKNLSTAQNHTLFIKKSKNIIPLPSYFYPVIFSQKQRNSCVKYSNSLWEITTCSGALAPRRKPCFYKLLKKIMRFLYTIYILY